MGENRGWSGQATVDRLSRRSMLIFMLLALVAICTYLLLAGETSDERASAAEINYAGKRRMLSQRIGLLSAEYLRTQQAEELSELAAALRQIEDIHATLRHGDPQRGLRPPHSAELKARYQGPQGLDATMASFLALGSTLLRQASNGEDYRASAEALIHLSRGELLTALDQLVDLYQRESEASTDTLRLLLWCALLAGLGLFALAAFGVLRPLIAQVRHSLEEQEASETALRQAVEKNQLILQAAGEGIFGVDRNGRISFANPAATALLGRDSGQLGDLESHHAIMHGGGSCPICQVLADGGTPRRSEGQFSRPGNAADFPVEYTVAPRADGEGAVISFRDISEQRAAQAKLQRFQQRLVDAIEALDDAFTLFDSDDRLTQYNLRFTETFPLRGEVIRLGMRFSEFVRAIAEQQLYTVPDERLDDWIDERMAMHQRAEGSSEIPLGDGRWLRVTERRTREGGTLVIWSDVSDLKQARIAADQANQAKSEFMARMSHELRTPLNAILGFAQVLDHNGKTRLSADQQECVSHILLGGHHLLALINELLDLAAIEAGHLQVAMEEFALAPLLQECIALVSPQAADRQVRLTSADTAGVHVRGDGKRLKQVLLNLLSNGIKYNRVGGQLTLMLGQTTGGIRLSVADTGHGIAPDLARRVFLPFDRLGTSHGEGTGIGLSITRRMVELMGGQIGFDSELGVGTTFWIELDAATSESPIASRIPAPAAPAPEQPAPPALPCVVAIGLEAAETETLRLIVSTLRDIRLITAANLAEAHAVIAAQGCRAVVAEPALARQLLAELPSTDSRRPFVIALGERPLVHASEPRIHHWHPKPMKVREIARTLREATA
ncbi:hypothetical protein AT959_16065 [Dechloromonas denitrificans]|uniref:histidine kinase n=1 Tax=Dechloromonas denitrificans TaxID=281362 RepID=A0A133XEZ0_9RHOO|nr:ATP-binding protein [Dechloromonas denitrificans]KXB29466.1 hypothetical protein AT959_16065 [Dechloromonas denitrificans]